MEDIEDLLLTQSDSLQKQYARDFVSKKLRKRKQEENDSGFKNVVS